MNFTIPRPIRTGALEFTREDLRHGTFLIVPAIIAIAAVLLFAAYQCYSTTQQLADDQRQLAALSAMQAPLVDAQQSVDDAKSTVTTLRTHRMSELRPLERLSVLNDSLPGSVRLNSVTIGAAGIAVTGETHRPSDLIAAEKNLTDLKVSSVSSGTGTSNGVYSWEGSFK